jgi:hypothetical protein
MVVGGRFSATAIIGPGVRRLLLAQRFLKTKSRDTTFLPPKRRLEIDGIKLTIMQATNYTGLAFIY